MPDLILHGVPSGHSVSKCDDKVRSFFDLFYGSHNPGINTHVMRRNNQTIYSFLMYENAGSSFRAFDGRAGSYFGMSLVFDNQYVTNSDVVFKVLQKTYDNYVKNKIIKECPDGAKQWLCPTLATPGDEAAIFVAKGLSQILKDNPDLRLYTQPLPPLQNQSQRY
jgi:hypothetical protein